jgi:hypothetical protein
MLALLQKQRRPLMAETFSFRLPSTDQRLTCTEHADNATRL